MLKLQFLIGKKYNEEWSTVKNCNSSKLQFFKCNFTVISLHIFAVYYHQGRRNENLRGFFSSLQKSKRSKGSNRPSTWLTNYGKLGFPILASL